MALTLKKPIAELHKKEQHIRVRTSLKAKRTTKKSTRKARAGKQLSLFGKKL